MAGDQRPRVVAVGGGHGLSRALAALRHLDVDATAVVTVADDGGSSGRLRRDLGVIPPGDLRMALLALARRRDLADLFGHRFSRGELAGHALGNLALVALAEQTGGDFVAALDRAAAMLDCCGRVLPATLAPVQLKARVSGAQVEGQRRVTRSGGRVERVWLEPGDPPVCEEAAAAVRAADAIVLGPGSLYTSVIAALLVPGLAAAIAAASAPVVYIGNLRTQPGETTGLNADGHVAALRAHVPGLRLDVAVIHRGPVASQGPGEPLGELDDTAVGRVVAADIAARDPDGSVSDGHDPERLAAVLGAVLDDAVAAP
ncbi:MAG TPA: uridine diphosphate-N-acetylglucosamine-binding protein YvcK [Egibacteraceae bacterium]